MRVYPSKTFLLINNPHPPTLPVMSLSFLLGIWLHLKLLWWHFVPNCWTKDAFHWVGSTVKHQTILHFLYLLLLPATCLSWFRCLLYAWMTCLLNFITKMNPHKWHRCWYDGNQISFWTALWPLAVSLTLFGYLHS